MADKLEGPDPLTQRVWDELCIMRRLATLARAQDDMDRETYKSCFTDRVLLTEAVLFPDWEPREIPIEELADMYFSAVEKRPCDGRQHMVFNHVIDVRGDEAVCEADLHAINVIVDGERTQSSALGGRYRLKLRRENDTWLICERAIRERYRIYSHPDFNQLVVARGEARNASEESTRADDE
jgi:hypothetical protein